VVLLHGLGGNPDRVFSMGRALSPPDAIVIAPTALKTYAGQKYEDLRLAAAAKLPIMQRFPHWWSYSPDAFALLALDYALSHYPVDTNKIRLVGYSMGGFGTWNIGLRYHDRFAAIAPLAGGISREEYVLGKDPLVRKLLGNARSLPSFFVHGDADKVVPVKFDQWTRDILEKRKFEYVYREVAGGKHVLSDFLDGNTLRDELTDWVQEQVREPNPKVVEHNALGAYHGGAYWVRIDGLKDDSGRVVATANPEEGTIEIETTDVTELTVFLDDALFAPKAKVKITVDGKVMHKGRVKPTLMAVAESFARAHDPKLVYERAVSFKLR
jgi:predicted esterase